METKVITREQAIERIAFLRAKHYMDEPSVKLINVLKEGFEGYKTLSSSELEKLYKKESGHEIIIANKSDLEFRISDINHKSLKEMVDQVEKEIILKILECVGGNREKAAKMLGFSVRTFYTKIKGYDL